MSSNSSVWYPGRLCLVGEHCDWAGGSSLAIPVKRGIGVVARRADAGAGVRVRSELEGERLEGRWPVHGEVDPDGGPLRFVPAALHLLASRKLAAPPATLEVESDLPAARGLSSSAAFTLAVLDALARLGGHRLEAEELAGMAFEVENGLLGVECGLLDQLSSASRAPVLIRWGTDLPGGYRLERIPVDTPFHFLVGAFSEPRDTVGILAALNRVHRSGGRSTAHAFAAFTSAAEAAAAALVDGDATGLGSQMNRAQAAYEEHLEASLPELAAPRLAQACRRVRELGALGAKFSGAGGDGSIVAVFADREDAERAGSALESEFALETDYLELSG